MPLLALAASSPALSDPCPAVDPVPAEAEMCLKFEITVKNALPDPLDWWSADCTASGGYLLAVNQSDGGKVPLPPDHDDEVFIPAGGERKLFAWQDKPASGECKDVHPDSEPQGAFALHLRDGPADAIFTLFYHVHQKSREVHVLAPQGWSAPALGNVPAHSGGAYWGWNISTSTPPSSWGGFDGTSSMTYTVAGCTQPMVPRHGTDPANWARATKSPSVQGEDSCKDKNCATLFDNCCVSQAEYECDSHNHWQLDPPDSSPEYSPSICTADGSWSNPQQCTSHCGPDPEDAFADVENGDYEEIYTCKLGFSLKGLGPPHSCPPNDGQCSHEQPGYRRTCDPNSAEKGWVISGDESTGDVSQCLPPDAGCCVSTCGSWPLGTNLQNEPAADGKSTTYTCETGFVMEGGKNDTLRMECSWNDAAGGGYALSPQDPPECHCEQDPLTVPDGWKSITVDSTRLQITCEGEDPQTYKCSGGVLKSMTATDTQDTFCCTGTFDSPVTYPKPCGKGKLPSPDELKWILIGAGGAVGLLVCCCCMGIRWAKKGNQRDGLRTTLIDIVAAGVGTSVSPTGSDTRSTGIDPRMSFASQMQARVERAADERSRRDLSIQSGGGDRARGSTASSPSGHSTASGSRYAGGTGGGTGGTGRSRPDTSSSTASSRIEQFKGGSAPDMIPFESLKLLGKIGTGSSGAVFEGELKGTSVAVKRLNLILDAGTSEQFLAEVSMLTKVTHPNVVLFFGVSFDDRDHDCYLVTEYCGRGNLQEYLAQETLMARPLKLKMALDVARGMNFLHQSDIIHRDLKSVRRQVTATATATVTSCSLPLLHGYWWGSDISC